MLKNLLKTLRINEQKISVLLGAAVVVIVGVLIYNYFTGINRPPGSVGLTSEEQPTVKTHLVAKGETLWQISLKYYNNGFKWVEIAKENKLVNPNLIESGQTLIIPELKETPIIGDAINGSEYVVVKGDSLWKIAVRAYADGYQWVKVWSANKLDIPNPNLIEVGTKLILPR